MQPISAKEDLALRSIVAYKLIKSAAALALALVLIGLLPFGLPDWFAELALKLRHRFVQAWSIRLADLLVSGTSRHRLNLTIGALFLDGSVTGVEAWSLKRRLWWGPWLVVVASGALLPLEVKELLRHPHLSRVAMLVVNLAVVVFFAHHAWRARAARRDERTLTSG